MISSIDDIVTAELLKHQQVKIYMTSDGALYYRDADKHLYNNYEYGLITNVSSHTFAISWYSKNNIFLAYSNHSMQSGLIFYLSTDLNNSLTMDEIIINLEKLEKKYA